MFGFSAFISQDIKSKTFRFIDEIKSIKTANIVAFNHMIKKFEKDRVFFENEEFVLVIDGIILNKHTFLKGMASWPDSIIRLYKENGDEFFSEFRGSFSGLLYDKVIDKTIIFTDHIGSKFTYYYKGDDGIFVSSYIANVYSFFKENKIHYSLNVENSYLLLTYGYMLDDRTLCSEIHKIQPGCYIVYEKGSLTEKQYFLLDNTPDYSINEHDAIEMMDQCFRNAIQLQFGKDEEYGYRHLVGLSAGLDSRMVTWVAHELGYVDQLNYTFSQSGFWDETVPKQIATDLKHEWIFKPLDNGLWLYNIDPITKVNAGEVLYYGQAHNYSILKYLNFKDFGILHSGQQGDIAFDTYYTTDDIHKKFVLGEGAYSLRLLDRIHDIKLKEYSNEEIAHYYCRSFAGANHGALIEFEYTDEKSPFGDIDLLSTNLHIPLKYRMDRNLYFKWILQKYPKAGDYVWDHIGRPISNMWGLINIGGKKIPIEQLPLRIVNKIHPLDYFIKRNMNPIKYYMQINDDLNQYLHGLLREHVDLITDNQLKNDVLYIMNNNNYMEKIQAISLLRALYMFY